MKNWVAGKDFAGKIDKLKTDVYVMGEAGFRKAIDAVGFAEGRYTNMVDGSPIRISVISKALFTIPCCKNRLSRRRNLRTVC
jgi:hypothetical protein